MRGGEPLPGGLKRKLIMLAFRDHAKFNLHGLLLYSADTHRCLCIQQMDIYHICNYLFLKEKGEEA